MKKITIDLKSETIEWRGLIQSTIEGMWSCGITVEPLSIKSAFLAQAFHSGAESTRLAAIFPHSRATCPHRYRYSKYLKCLRTPPDGSFGSQPIPSVSHAALIRTRGGFAVKGESK